MISVSIGQLLSAFGQLGADWIVVRQESSTRASEMRNGCWCSIHVALLLAGAGLSMLALALFVTADTVAVRVFHAPSLAPMLRLTAMMTPIAGTWQVLIYATQAFKEMKDAALVRNILQPVLRLAFVAVAIALFDELLLAYAAVMLAEIVLLAISVAVLQRRISLIGPVAPIETGKLS